MDRAIGRAVDRPLQALSDTALVAASLPRASSAGCYPWLVALTLPVPIGLGLGPIWALLSLGSGVLMSLALSRLRERSLGMRQARQAEDEFGQRFGERAFEQALDEASALLTRDAAAEAVLCLRGCGLPHGGQHLVRIDLVGREGILHVHQAPWLSDLWRYPERMHEIRRETQRLSQAAADQLRTRVAAVSLDQTGPEDEFVYDGSPCVLVLLRRGVEPQRWQLNLDGVGTDQASHPVTHLIASLLELGARRREKR